MMNLNGGLRKNINSELEELRNSVCKNSVDESLTNLEERTSRIHAAYLFHPVGQSALQNLCLAVSSTGPNCQINGWKDLAGCLGFSFHQIGCIENYQVVDSTELVLMTYAQGENATLSRILRALLSIKRPDAVTKAQSSIIKMVDAILLLHNLNQSNDVKRNYFNNNVSHEIMYPKEAILKPNNFCRLKQKLPITLREVAPFESSTPSIIKPLNQMLVHSIQSVTLCQQVAPTNRINSLSTMNDSASRVKRIKMRTVFLSFADDAKEIAYRISQQLRQDRATSFPIGVVILEEQEKYVCANPEQFIMRCFAQVDYVVPILSRNYLEILSGRPVAEKKSVYESLDERYIGFIHDLMLKYYVDNQCRNNKIRCILPAESKKLLETNIMKNDPSLRIWIMDDKIDDFIARISVQRM